MTITNVQKNIPDGWHKYSASATLIALLFFAVVSCANNTQKQGVKVGLDRIDDYNDLFYAKRVGIITNHTAVTSQGVPILEVFKGLEGVTIGAVFGPEHGLKGVADAGEKIADSSAGSIPVYSLYGKTRKPTAKMLENVDMLVFDIQDIGTRYYTYIWTMALSMEAAAEAEIPFVVLDRPNPISGLYPQGNLLDSAFATFVGLYPIPVRHGMTAGELAGMFSKMGWLNTDKPLDLTVIPALNWTRDMYYNETGLKFIKPSPNMPDLQSALLYPGTCLLEGTNVSEGRGTDKPFRIFGAPWLENEYVVRLLNDAELLGLRFEMMQFRPQSISGATSPKYQDQLCLGIRIEIEDRDAIDPYFVGIYIVKLLHDLYPDNFEFREAHFDRLCGTDKIRKAIENGSDFEEMRDIAQEGLEEFKELRLKYLLYK